MLGVVPALTRHRPLPAGAVICVAPLAVTTTALVLNDWPNAPVKTAVPVAQLAPVPYSSSAVVAVVAPVLAKVKPQTYTAVAPDRATSVDVVAVLILIGLLLLATELFRHGSNSVVGKVTFDTAAPVVLK